MFIRYSLFSHLFQRLQHLRIASSHASLWKVLAAMPEQAHYQQADTARQYDIGSRQSPVIGDSA